jgi:GT2 family glycosyltransferase
MYCKLADRVFPPGSKGRLFAEGIVHAVMKLKAFASSVKHEHINRFLYYLKIYVSYLVEEKILGAFSRASADSRMGSGVAIDRISPNHSEYPDMVSRDVAVSIIIPAENAGNSFHHLLTMARNQTGVRQIEIIVVDSGSDDNTLEVARYHGARIVKISPEKFSHSFSRNLGAENASGDFLFFTVQDALLPSDMFLYEMLDALQKKEVSAVSCAEFPREDADLFYSACCWNRYKFLEVNRKDRILSKPERENYATLRKNGQLSDVACLIPRKLFLEYKYREDCAEDLDLGIRLIRDGHKIAFLSSLKIIHSHNRPPSHYLRRGYADQVWRRNMFPDYPASFIEPTRLRHEIMVSFGAINSLVNCAGEGFLFPCKIDDFLRAVAGRLKHARQSREPSLYDRTTFIDHEMIAFLELIGAKAGKDGTEGDRPLLLDSILNFLERRVFKFLKNSFDTIDEELAIEVYHAVYKSFAFLCGVRLADSTWQHPGGMLSTRERHFHGTV